MSSPDPLTKNQIGNLPIIPQSLPDLFAHIHVELARSGLWKMPDSHIYRCHWQPWQCWEQVGYTTSKLKQLIKWYMVEGRLARASTLITQACKRPEWSTVAYPLGTYEAKPGSPLRYKLGQCMQLIVFRFHPMVGIVPQVTWRTIEPTRRMIADWVVLDNIFRYIKHTTGLPIAWVEMQFNLVWLANFNAPLADAWMPGLRHIVPKYKKRFLTTNTPPQYRARKYAWDLVHNAEPMFDGYGGELLESKTESDWPRMKKELIV